MNRMRNWKPAVSANGMQTVSAAGIPTVSVMGLPGGFTMWLPAFFAALLMLVSCAGDGINKGTAGPAAPGTVQASPGGERPGEPGSDPASEMLAFPTSRQLTFSDRRFKDRMTSLTDVLEKLETIRGVSFEWDQNYRLYHRLAKQQRTIGVIAQDVEKVFPELVTAWGREEYRAVDYNGLIGVLIEAVKELKARNEELRDRVETLEVRQLITDDLLEELKALLEK